MERQGIEHAEVARKSNENGCAGEGTDAEVDHETLQDLRELFDLYDVDRSGMNTNPSLDTSPAWLPTIHQVA